jgi:Family of unknown function (DUF5681)
MSDDDGRDERGRWKKGFCPNRKGRPRKKPPISEADINYFKNTQIEVMINKQPRQLTRHEVLLNAMFDKAMKGNVTMQRLMHQLFERSDETYIEAQAYLRDLELAYADKLRRGEEDEKLEREIRIMRSLLSRGHPDWVMGRPPPPEPRKRKPKAEVAPEPPVDQAPTNDEPDEDG